MNIRHDSYHWESEFVRNGDVAEIVGLLEKTGLTEWEDGAFQLDLTDHGFEKKMVLKRANGTSLYITRDLAYHRWKSANSDRSVDILGADHKLVSGQLRTALRPLGHSRAGGGDIRVRLSAHRLHEHAQGQVHLRR